MPHPPEQIVGDHLAEKDCKMMTNSPRKKLHPISQIGRALFYCVLADPAARDVVVRAAPPPEADPRSCSGGCRAETSTRWAAWLASLAYRPPSLRAAERPTRTHPRLIFYWSRLFLKATPCFYWQSDEQKKRREEKHVKRLFLGARGVA